VYAHVMQLAAAIVAAVAAIIYTGVTIWMVFVMRAAAEQQKRVAELMEADLRSRTSPNLFFAPQAGSVHNRRGTLKNIGKGTATNVRYRVTFQPTNRVAEASLGHWLEPGMEATFNIGLDQASNETRYAVEVDCDDTIGFAHYTFGANEDVNREPRIQPKKR
jgi:hypothetical protein